MAVSLRYYTGTTTPPVTPPPVALGAGECERGVLYLVYHQGEKIIYTAMSDWDQRFSRIVAETERHLASVKVNYWVSICACFSVL